MSGQALAAPASAGRIARSGSMENLMERDLAVLSDAEAARCAPLAGGEAGFGALASDRGPLPLKALSVTGAITGLQYRLVVRQTFVNTHPEPLEASYIFPLPERAAVSRFVLKAGRREIEGVLKERGAARVEYDRAIQTGRRAAIAEEERANVFTMRAGNILPRETAEVELTLDGPLSLEAGEATLRFPFVVAPRYIPGTPLPGDPVGDGVAQDTDAAPDASRISPPVLLPGFPSPVLLSLEIEVDPAGLPFAEYRSSLHAVAAEGAGQGRMRIRLQPGERLNRDFILRFRIGGAGIATALSLTPDAPGKAAGTFTLTLVPPELKTETAPKPRDILFVLDRSGSMEGWKMVAARRAVARMVETLTERDRFEIFAFDDQIDSFRKSLVAGGTPRGERAFWNDAAAPAEDGPWVAANERNRFRAVDFLGGIESRGGTEMAQPVLQAVERLGASDPARDRIVVLATDGQIGNEQQVLAAIAPKLGGLRVFTLGIDTAANEAFLKQFAALGGGACELVESEQRLDEAMDAIHRRIGAPVLTDLKLDAQGLALDAESVAPRRLPDLFAGVPVTIQGRYAGEARGAVALQARAGGGGAWTSRTEGVESANPAAEKIWARAHLRDLEDRVAARHPDAGALQRRILETSLTHGVLCRYTAFVAVDRAEAVNRGGKQHQVMQAVEQPEGWGMGADRKELETRSRYFMACRVAAAPMPFAKREDMQSPMVMADLGGMDDASLEDDQDEEVQGQRHPTTMLAAVAPMPPLPAQEPIASLPAPVPPAVAGAPMPEPGSRIAPPTTRTGELRVPAVSGPASVSAAASGRSAAPAGTTVAQSLAAVSMTFWVLVLAILVGVGLMIAWYLFWTPKEGLTPPNAPEPALPAHHVDKRGR